MKKEAMLYKRINHEKVHCYLCAHHCKIQQGRLGFCQARQNIAGRLYTLVYGETIARHVDPIEKKPIYHFKPGASVYSIATAGCNFQCPFCQNWQISQLSEKRSEQMSESKAPKAFGDPFSPEQIVAAALENKCSGIAYTYTEPTIFFEYAFETARLAREYDLDNIFVTNGYMTAQALGMIAPYLNAANVDLKAWDASYYQDYCKARKKPVLDTIRRLHAKGIWLEITTLIIPGENDSEWQFEGISRFIASVDVDIPWHISRFHPQYRFLNHTSTPLQTLQRAAEIGRSNNLRYIYMGNIAPYSNTTNCYQCAEPIVLRSLGDVAVLNLKKNKCQECGARIAGVWE
jgi:pyruvate formate lyase activating enzyme